MRNNLNSLTKIFTLPFLVQNLPVNAARSHIRVFSKIFINKAFVMAKVQVSLGSVVGYIALSVLVRVQGSRVYVDVGIEFLNGDTQAACLQKFGQRGRDDSFAQR